MKEQKKNIKESVNSLIPRKAEERSSKSQKKRSTGKSPENLDSSTKKLLHNLDNLEQLYDLIIFNY